MKTLAAILALMTLIAAPAFSQDAAAKKDETGQRHALKSATCEPACGFAVKSHDEAEIINMVQIHAKKHHNREMTEADVKKMIKEERVDEKEDD